MSDSHMRELLPPRRAVTAARVRRAALLWVAGVAVLLALVRVDVSVVAYAVRHVAPGEHWLLNGLRDLAEFWVITAACVAACIFDRRRWVVVAHVLFALLLGFVMMSVGKILVHRVRPLRFAKQIEDVPWFVGWDGFHPDLRRAIGNAMDVSMPSGHTFTAFAMAFTLGWFYPRLRWPMLVLAGGTACSRVLQAMHWPSDCWAGALIGYLAAWMSLRTRSLSFGLRKRRGAHAALGR